MKRLLFVAGLVPLLMFSSLGFAAPTGGPGVPIIFQLPQGISPTGVFVQFLNTAGTMSGYYLDAKGTRKPLRVNKAYSMAEITGPQSVGGGAPANVPAVYITNFISGRIYINYGKTGLSNLGGSYQPNPSQPNDANYAVRYQYFEINGNGGAVTTNLSYIDLTAIPLSLQAINAPHASNNPQNTTARGIPLAAAAGTSATSPNSNVLPSPASMLPNPQFTRVISPQWAGTPYHDWTNYLQSTLQGKTVLLAGFFAGVGNQPSGNPLTQAQSYDFTVTFNQAGDATFTAQPDSGNGSAACVPKSMQGPGVGATNQTVTITFADLNAHVGIYGNNPSYTINNNGSIIHTPGILNDFFGRVVGDLLAGLSFGFPGSSVNFNGQPIGGLSSTQWWGGILPNGTAVSLQNTPAGQNIAFAKAQPGQPLNYHTYAGSLSGLTSGYGFPLQDRLGTNLLQFNTQQDANSYLQVSINPD